MKKKAKKTKQNSLLPWMQGHIEAARKLLDGPITGLFHVHKMEDVSKEIREAVYALNRASNLLEKRK